MFAATSMMAFVAATSLDKARAFYGDGDARIAWFKDPDGLTLSLMQPA
jgi:hypothetical protein